MAKEEKHIVLKNNNGHIEIVSKHNTLANAKKSANKIIRQLAKEGDEDALDYLLDPNDENETMVASWYVGLDIVSTDKKYAVVCMACDGNECNFITLKTINKWSDAVAELALQANLYDTFFVPKGEEIQVTANLTEDCVFLNLNDGMATTEYKIVEC